VKKVKKKKKSGRRFGMPFWHWFCLKRQVLDYGRYFLVFFAEIG
jgi:hypothetical protein